jgi:hypothetical protein
MATASLQHLAVQAQGSADVFTKARKSLTLVRVGPVHTSSPMAAK